MPSTRTEKDSLGSMKVPLNAYYGIHTVRSFHNFQISGNRWHPLLIASIAQLKLACARANAELKLLPKRKLKVIEKACRKIITGELEHHFPLDVYQAGSGTSTNMNVNEVIANLAAEALGGKKGDRSLVHPNDDVNKGQSTNNVVPSAIRIASLACIDRLLTAVDALIAALEAKATEFKNVLKSGRTHLQDAVPMTLGQEFGAYATALAKHRARLIDANVFLQQLGIGGNAVGTGLNTPKKFRSLIVKYLNKQMKSKCTVSPDGIESTQFLTDIAATSSVLKLFAVDLNKICNDLRLLSSGPNTGFAEISLPAVEPGSSIMPGKVNPSICEMVNMVCMRVCGNDTTITMSCSAGNLELNTHMPIIGHCLMESFDILTNAIGTLAHRCVTGIEANSERCQWYLEHSMGFATALNPIIGYDAASALVKEALESGKSLRELILEKGLLSEKDIKKALDSKKLTKPNL